MIRRCLTGFFFAGMCWLAAQEMAQTVITAQAVEMFSGETHNRFLFEENVEIRGTNLVATCDRMEVIAARVSAGADTESSMGAIERIVMHGNVVIVQEERRATAGTAEILPAEGRVLLSEAPRVTDGQGTVTGYKMILHKDRKRVEILSDPNAPTTGNGRATITLPPIQDMGYEDPTERNTSNP